jgi:coenzyme F420-dependent glucose-6-phosphate dehydrogenase
MSNKFGYKASNEQFAPRELLRYGVLAEENGFDSVFVSDHLQPWRHDGGHAPFAMSWLGALGASTERITMGTSVLTPTFRYHPAIVAQAAATLAEMFPGRFWLSLGTGQALNEHINGGGWPEKAERRARVRDAAEVIRALWAGEEVSRGGPVWVEAARLYTRPERPPVDRARRDRSKTTAS